MLQKYFFLWISFLTLSTATSQSIFLDENTDDWSNAFIYDDSDDDHPVNLLELGIADDRDYLYFLLRFDQEIALQDNQNFTLTLESTDFRLNYNFRSLEGEIIFTGNSISINHSDIGLKISPTVTSSEFEIQIKKSNTFNNQNFVFSQAISVEISNFDINSDQLPEGDPIIYTLTNMDPPANDYTLGKSDNTDLRILTYNVQFDRMFEQSVTDEYNNIMNTILPDVFVFQEIFDHGSAQTLNRLRFEIDCLQHSDVWYHEKRGSGLVVISRFAIIDSKSIDGNGVFILDVNGQEVAVINIHLPCCDNDSNREFEIDNVLNYLRRARAGQESPVLATDTPFIILGDTNFVGFRNQVSAIVEGNIFNNNANGPDFSPDWDDSSLGQAQPFVTGQNTMYTWNSPRSRFSPGRLDYIFYSDFTLNCINSFVFDSEHLTDRDLFINDLDRFDVRFASDHLPVISDFSFKITTSTSNTEQQQLEILAQSVFTNDITLPSELLNQYDINVITLQGQIVQPIVSEITAIKQSGLYLIQFIDKKTNKSYSKKVFLGE